MSINPQKRSYCHARPGDLRGWLPILPGRIGMWVYTIIATHILATSVVGNVGVGLCLTIRRQNGSSFHAGPGDVRGW